MALERNDKWGSIVYGRLQSCNDLVAEEAIFFKYELTAYPTSLFKEVLIMRKTSKSVLMKQLTSDVPVDTDVNTRISSFVVDEGWLLHKVKWQQGSTYGEIVQQYILLIRRH